MSLIIFLAAKVRLYFQLCKEKTKKHILVMLDFVVLRGILIENSKKVAIKFGRMKGNVYFCRQEVIKRNET